MATAFRAEAKRMMPIATELPESKRKAGRPTERTEEIIEQISERLANGETLAAICKDPKMPNFSTVWRWEFSDAQFSNVSQRARTIGTHFLADDCLRIADDTEIDPRHKHYMIDTRMRLIGKWNAKIYGDRKVLAGDPDAPLVPRTIDPRRLDPEQRELLKQLLLEASRPIEDGEFTETDQADEA